MKPCHTILLLVPLTLASCDKAKDMAEKARSAVQQKIKSSAPATTTETVDPELAKLVDRTPDGVIFRTDLPFPTRLEVRSERRNRMAGRFVQTSAIEKKSETVNGTLTLISKLELAGNVVRYTAEQSDFIIPNADNPEAAKRGSGDLLENALTTHKPVSFRKTGKTWKTEDADGFRAAVLSKQLTPVFDELLMDHALAPRPLWFTKKRFKEGDEIQISGESMIMVFAGKAKGSLKLKLESFEPVKGHPCAVFSVTGDFSRKQYPDFDGNLTDEDVTIQSGKVWLSLIHPIVLKEELDTIQTFKHGGQGGLVGRGQGTVNMSVLREWKRL